MDDKLKSISRVCAGFLIFVVIFGFMILLTACLAEAQGLMRCADREVIVERLINRYGESLTATGMNRQQVMEIWTSEETGSFTVLLTSPDGMSCIAATGRNWFAIQPPAEGIDG